MKNIRIFLSKNFPFLVVKFSIYLNRHVYIMITRNHNCKVLHFMSYAKTFCFVLELFMNFSLRLVQELFGKCF